MKIGIFSPYWQMSGGGEKYLLTIALHLSQNNKVYLFADRSVRTLARRKFGLDLSRAEFMPPEKLSGSGPLGKILLTKGFDLIFYMTDGSLFFSSARKNFLMVQSPVHIPSHNPINSVKMLNWKIICYSLFMRKIIEKSLGRQAYILSPEVDPGKYKGKAEDKKNIILSVGRFFKYPHHKRHDILVEVFKNSFRNYFRDWKLVIAGALTEKGGEEIIEELKKAARGYPVEIVENPDFDKLVSFYREAKIYWHAAGFGEDLLRFPEKAEHFGITTLEAMAAGCVPVVFSAGGQEDIVNEGVNGFLWKTEKELIDKTRKLINDRKLYLKLSANAGIRSTDFSPAKFDAKLEELIRE